jgi:hypothetical protein
MAIIKKQFGLGIACRIAGDLIKSNKVPVSIVLSNLIELQKTENFPEHLDESYFHVLKEQSTTPDKRVLLNNVLSALKSPNNFLSTADLLEFYIKDGWVTKKSAPKSKDSLAVKMNLKNLPKNKVVVKNKKTVQEPKKEVKVTFKTKRVV